MRRRVTRYQLLHTLDNKEVMYLIKVSSLLTLPSERLGVASAIVNKSPITSLASVPTLQVCINTYITPNFFYPQNLPLFLCCSLMSSSCSRIPLSSCLCLSLVSSNSRACSFLSSVNSSSSFSCQGYRTNIWKHSAEEPMTKLVREKPRVMSIAHVNYREPES